MSRRPAAVLCGLAGALLSGGVAQTLLWRWGMSPLGDLLGSQFTWVLLTFAVSWAWAKGKLAPGIAAGALTGLALIASYYATQWLVDGPHAAAAQFTKSGGLAWTLAAVAGGAAMGLFGALAGADPGRTPRRKASGLATPALIVGAGAPLWMLLFHQHMDASTLAPAVAVFVLAGAALLVWTAFTCGLVPGIQGTAVSLTLGSAALLALVALEMHGWLYLTF